MLYRTNTDGEIQSVDPQRIASVIRHTSPAVVSIRACDGSEITIADIAIDVRANGVHILLDAPEATLAED